MTISAIPVRTSSADFLNARSKQLRPYQDIVATPGKPVKADEVILSTKALKLMQTKPIDAKSVDIKPFDTGRNEPPVLWSPKDLPTVNATQFTIDGPVKELDLTKPNDPPVLWAPSTPVVSTDEKKTIGDIKNIGDNPIIKDGNANPPRTRAEAWQDGWKNLGAATKRLMELVEMAKQPSLSAVDRAKLDQEFKSIVDNLNKFADKLSREQNLNAADARIWRNSLGSKELFIDGNDSLTTAESVQALSDKLNKRSEVVFRTMRYLGVA